MPRAPTINPAELSLIGIQETLLRIFEMPFTRDGVALMARRLKSGQPLKKVQIYPSQKNGCGLGCESSNEANLCSWLEHNPSVLEFRTQPFSLLRPSGTLYRPDCLARTERGLRVFEVKPLAKLSDPLVQSKLRALKHLFARLCIPFEVFSEESLSKRAWERVHLLESHRSYQPLTTELSRLLDSLATKRPTLSDLRNRIESRGMSHTPMQDKYDACIGLIASGYAAVDVEAWLDDDTSIQAGWRW